VSLLLSPRRTLKAAWAVGLALFLVVGLGACSEVRQGNTESGSWTVLSYSIADTDLEEPMMDDLTEMGSVDSSDVLSVVAFVDRAEGYSDDAVLGIDNWVGAKIIDVADGGATLVDDLGDVNTGDPVVLEDFIARGIRENPADHYALIISDHGASWPGVGGDESTDGDALSLAEINEAISAGLNAAGIAKLDLLGFDACLMATYEVASTLAPLADRLLASQELEPGHGWNYTALKTVVDNDGATVDELGAALIVGYEAQAIAEETAAEITLSFIDLTAMESVDAALATFSADLIDRAASISPAVGRSLATTLRFGTDPDPEQDSFMSDLSMLAATIALEARATAVAESSNALVDAIDVAVIESISGQANGGATGLSIYFPPSAESLDPSYGELEINPAWSEFLAAYYRAGSNIPVDSVASFADGDAEVLFDADGVTMTASFAPDAADNISAAYIRYGVLEDGVITFLGQEPADIVADGSGQVSGFYDLTTMSISDGEDSASAYLDMWSNDDFSVITIDVPLGYYPPGSETYQEALLSLVIDGESGDILSESYYGFNDSLGAYGALTTESDGIIVPEQLLQFADGTEEWVATSDYGLYADLPYLSYDFSALESGTVLYLELSVIDFGGNYDVVSATVEVP
jgi:hypothetical protein